MGYSQHWSLKHIEKNAISKEKLQSALNDMALVLEVMYSIKPEIFLADIRDEKSRYFKVVKNNREDVVSIEFGFFESFKINNKDICNSDYVKTARFDYDLAVVACLAILADVFDKKVVERSDGGTEDWELGVNLASKILGRNISNPKFDPEYDSAINRYECEHFGLYSEILDGYNKSKKWKWSRLKKFVEEIY